MQRIKNLSKRSKIVILLLIFLVFLIFWAAKILTPYSADLEYLNKAYNNESITINELEDWYEIIPDDNKDAEAIIFYPGGLVSADAYIYMLSQIAEGTKQSIYVVKFPLSLAVINIDAANPVIEQFPQVEKWTIMGHSLGGAMACRYAKDNSESIENLVLMASYCDKSIKEKDISVLTLYGSRNKGIDESKLSQYQQNLPEGSTTILIEGMNHAQFGNYGPQRGDPEPAITNEEATLRVVEETSKFLNGE